MVRTDREDERVAGLEDAGEPAVAFEAQLQVPAALLRGQHSAHQQWRRRAEVLHQLAGHACAGSTRVSGRISGACCVIAWGRQHVVLQHNRSSAVSQ